MARRLLSLGAGVELQRRAARCTKLQAAQRRRRGLAREFRRLGVAKPLAPIS
jgi:hypothetical protein